VLQKRSRPQPENLQPFIDIPDGVIGPAAPVSANRAGSAR
jgi:hypothetical protein